MFSRFIVLATVMATSSIVSTKCLSQNVLEQNPNDKPNQILFVQGKPVVGGGLGGKPGNAGGGMGGGLGGKPVNAPGGGMGADKPANAAVGLNGGKLNGKKVDKPEPGNVINNLNVVKPLIEIDFNPNNQNDNNQKKTPDEVLSAKGLILYNDVWVNQVEMENSPKINPLSSQIYSCQSEMYELNVNYNVTRNQLNQVNNRIISLRNYARSCQANRSSQRSRILNLENFIINCENKLIRNSNLSSSSIRDLKDDINSASREIQQCSSIILNIDNELVNVSEQLEIADSNYAELTSVINSLQIRYNSVESICRAATVSLESIVSRINSSYVPFYSDNSCIQSIYEFNKDRNDWTSIGPIYFAMDNLKFMALSVLKPIPIEPQRSGSKSFKFKTDNLITKQIDNLESRNRDLGANDQAAKAKFDMDLANFVEEWNKRMKEYESINGDPYVRGALREMTKIKKERYEIAPSRAFTKLIEHVEGLR